MRKNIELLKVKIDREKYYHDQATNRFFPLTVLLVGIALLDVKSFEVMKLNQISFFLFVFLVFILIIAVIKSLFTFFITRKNLEKHYDSLERKLK